MMMNTIKKCFVLLLLVSLQSCGQSKEVDFLVGTWKVEGKETYESWKKEGAKLIGESYKMKDSKKYVSETLEITEKNEQLQYTATVFNQNQGKGISFILQPVKDQLYSFENSAHDFPNKIQYKILSKTEVQVHVLGNDGKGFSYKMMKQL